MEEKYMALQEKLAGILKILNRKSDDADSQVHLELIDFDDLAGLLKQFTEEIPAIGKLHGDSNAAREWFVSKITAFRRGRQFLTKSLSASDGASPLNVAPLSELIRLYEQEAGKLRESAGSRGIPAALVSSRQSREYKNFKS